MVMNQVMVMAPVKDGGKVMLVSGGKKERAGWLEGRLR